MSAKINITDLIPGRCDIWDTRILVMTMPLRKPLYTICLQGGLYIKVLYCKLFYKTFMQNYKQAKISLTLNLQ